MTALWLHSPHLLRAEALKAQVRALGYLCREQPEACDLALVDLTATRAEPFPPPLEPALALVPCGTPAAHAHWLRLGYHGYLPACSPTAHLPQALETILAGGLWADPEAVAAAERTLPHLTDRERQVMTLLAQGLPNKRIAQRLGIAEKTVKIHVSSLLGKFRASNRLELMLAYGFSPRDLGP